VCQKKKNVKSKEKEFFKLTEGLTSAQLGEKKKWSKCPQKWERKEKKVS